MAKNPDPLEQYPAVRKWADQFHAVKGWKKPGDALPAGGAGLDARRLAATQALAKVSIGPEFLPDVRRAFDGGCKAIRNAIASAALEADFDPVDQQILSLTADIAAQRLVAAARRQGRAALDAAQAKFIAVQDRLDEGGYVHLQQALNAATAAHDAAGTGPAFDAARTRATDFLALADAGAAHAAEFATWNAAALAFIATEYTAGGARDTAEGQRVAVRAAAVAKSKAGDFAGATVALKGFPGDAKAADFGKAQVFVRALAAFEAQHEALCAEVTGTDLEGAKTHANDAKAARTRGLKEKRYDEGVAKLGELTAWCLPRLELARKLRSYDAGMNRLASFRDAKKKANDLQVAGDFAKALAALEELDKDPAVVKENASRVLDKRMAQRKDALVARLPGDGPARLGKYWAAHAAAVQAGDFDEAAKQAARVQNYFELEPILALKEEADAIFARHPAAKGRYGYLADFRAQGQAGKYAAARKAIEVALPLLRQLAVYLDTVAEAEAVRAALPVAPPTLREGIAAALLAADVKAMAKDPTGAAGDLRALLDGPDYFGLAAAIADWKAKEAAVTRRHDWVLKFLAGVPAVADPLVAEMDAARKLAKEQGAFAEAFLALARHEAKLVKAQAFATVRRQVLGIRDGVLKAAKADPAILAPAPQTEDGLKKDIAAAEALAAAGKFAEGEVAFGAVRSACDGLSRKAAAHFEDADAKGSNAGHSLDRHGPDVSLPDLIKRLQTGIPPNAKTADERSFTGASSKFRSPQDWLAGREVSAAAVRAAGVDLDLTSMPKPFEAQRTSMAFTVEHGKPIDEAFVGRQKNQKFDADKGEFVPDKTYESFEAMTGLTRSYVNWIWEFEVLKAVPVPDADPAKPPVVQDVKARDTADYIDNYRYKTGKAPDEIKGRWVMMQQFPVADGWDEALQTYTTNPEDLIP